jgi:hypothetical protein
MSNQSREDQYNSVGTGGKSMKQPRAYNKGTGKGALSDGAGKDPVQPNNRGPQGNGG